MDEARSSQFLKEYQDSFMFSSETPTTEPIQSRGMLGSLLTFI